MGMDISLLLANVIGPDTDMPPPPSLLACWEPGLPEAYLEPTRLAGCGVRGVLCRVPEATCPGHCTHHMAVWPWKDLHPFCF